MSSPSDAARRSYPNWWDELRPRREELERIGYPKDQAMFKAMEERLNDEWAENQRLWDQQPEATV